MANRRLSDYCFFCSGDLKDTELVLCSTCLSGGPRNAAERIRNNNKEGEFSEDLIKHMENIARNVEETSDEKWDTVVNLLVVGESTDLSH